jgi:hypothetical protein
MSIFLDAMNLEDQSSVNGSLCDHDVLGTGDHHHHRPPCYIFKNSVKSRILYLRIKSKTNYKIEFSLNISNFIYLWFI